MDDTGEPLYNDDGQPFVPQTATIRKKEKFDEHYDVKEQVGKGRYGTVYRCIEKDSGKVWAAKYIKALKSKDKDMARNEIETMNHLQHPKLLQCVDAFETANRVIMVTEYICGGELFERVVDDDFDLTEREVVIYMRQVCEGVQHMHQQNYLHLDLKPENIMCVDKVGTSIKLIDFGMARKLNPDENVKVLFGTPEFVAPEVVNYERIGFSTDMWSLGVICYVLLSGLSPFMGDTDAETLNNVTATEWDFDDEAFDDVAGDAKDFISKLLVKDKEERRTVTECLKHPWLARKAQTHRQSYRLRGASLRLKSYMARRRWQKTANAVRAIGRLAALRRFSAQKKAATGEDTPTNGDSASLDDQRLGQDERGQIEYTNGHNSEIDLIHPQSQTVVYRDTGDLKLDSHESLYQGEDLNRLHRDSDLMQSSDSRPITARHDTTRDNLALDTEAPFSNCTSDLTSSDRTSDLADYDQGLADFNSHTSDSEIMDITTGTNPARDAGDASTVIPAVYSGHRARKTTYNPPVIHQHLRNCSVLEETAVRFDCRISGFPEPRVYWYKDGRDISENGHFRIRFEGDELCSLVIREAVSGDEGVYKCEARNAAGIASTEAQLFVQVLDGGTSDPEDNKEIDSVQSSRERPASCDIVRPDETKSLSARRNNRRERPKPVAVTDGIRAVSSDRADLECPPAGGDKRSSDWTPKSSSLTSAAVSPNKSPLERDTLHRRVETHTETHSPLRNRGTGRVSRFDDRNKIPKLTVNSARVSLRSTEFDATSKSDSLRTVAPRERTYSSGTSEKPPYAAIIDRPSRLRLAELETKRKPRSSSEPPPEFQQKRDLILTRQSKPEKSGNYSSKNGKNLVSRGFYESALKKFKSSKAPPATEGSVARPAKSQLATKIAVFSGTGSGNPKDNKSIDRKASPGKEIKVKTFPKVVVSREESHTKEHPIESIRGNHTKLNGRVSEDDSLTDSERSSVSSGQPETKKSIYRTEKTFNLQGDKDSTSGQSESVLAWKIEKFAKSTPLKSPSDLKDDKTQFTMQSSSVSDRWKPVEDTHQKKPQSVDRALYPGQGRGSLASKIDKFSKNKSSSSTDAKSTLNSHEPASLKRGELSHGKVADKTRGIGVQREREVVDVKHSKNVDSPHVKLSRDVQSQRDKMSREPLREQKSVQAPQKRYELNQVKTTDKREKIEDDSFHVKSPRNGVPSRAQKHYIEHKINIDRTDKGTSDKLPNDVIDGNAVEAQRAKSTLDYVIKTSKDKGKVGVTFPVESVEKPIEINKTATECALPPANDRQATKEKTRADQSNVTSKVEVVLKTASSDLCAEPSAVKKLASTRTNLSLGNGPKETTSAAKTKSNSAMNRGGIKTGGIKTGGISQLTARFESGKPVSSATNKQPGKTQPVTMSRLDEKKQLFDGASRPKTNGNTVNYRDVLSSSTANTKLSTASSIGKPSVDNVDSSAGIPRRKPPASNTSRYQGKPVDTEKPPVFIQRPKDQTGIQGGSVRFSVSIDGDPTPDLSWHYKGRSIKDDGRCEVYSEDDLYFLEVFDLTPSDAGFYTCRLVNPVGRCSAMADLKVTEKPKPVVPRGEAPSVVHKLSNCEVCEGDNARFECEITGDPSPEVTWIVDGKEVHEGTRHHFLRTPCGTCALEISDVREDDDGVYTCTAKNAFGVISTTAELIVVSELAEEVDVPQIKNDVQIEKVQAQIQLATPRVKDEDAIASKRDKIHFKTEEAEEDETNDDVFKEEEETSTKTSDDFEQEPVANQRTQPRRASLQSASSAPKPPEFILRPRSQHITPPETARFTYMFKGNPTPTVTWMKKTKALKDEGRFEIYQDGGEHFLEIYDTVEEDAGRYTCVIANELGRTTSSANIAVRGKAIRDIPPKFTQRLTNCRTQDGGVGRFSGKVGGEPAPTIQWLFLGKEISPEDDIYEITFDGEKATLVLPEVLPEDEGEYECIARNRAGEMSCRARLTVEIPPSASSEPIASDKPVVAAEPIPQKVKQVTNVFEKKAPKTDIVLQTDDVIRPRNHPEQKERVTEVTEDASTASSDFEQDTTNYESSSTQKEQLMISTETLKSGNESSPTSLSNVDQEKNKGSGKPYGDISLGQSVTNSNKLPFSKTESVPSRLELKLDLESEPELEVTKKTERRSRSKYHDDHDTTGDVIEAQMDGLSEGEVSDTESQNVESTTEGRDTRMDIQVNDDRAAERGFEGEMTQSKPEFLQTPSDVEVMDGSPLALTVKVTGTPEPDVVWIFDGCDITEDDDFKLLHDGQLHSLVIREVYPEDAGIYYCKAVNTTGEIRCSARIVVKDAVCQGTPPRFLQQPCSVTVDEGSCLRVTCKVEGDPEPALTWSKDGQVISPSQRIIMKKLGVGTLRILQIPAVLATDAGSYTCTISNSYGEEKCSVSVVVHPLEEEQTDFRQLLKSRPRLQNINNNNALDGNKDGNKNERSASEAEAQQLDFRHVLTRHVGTKTAPKFMEGLKDMRVKEGEMAVFQCRVEGAPKPNVVWTVDGREIKESKYFKMTTEGTLAKLTITEAFPEDEGEYSCIASNKTGQDKTTSDLKIIPWEEEEDDFLKSPDLTSPSDPKDNLDELFKRSLTISEDDDDGDIDADNPSTPPHLAITTVTKKQPPPVPAKKNSLSRARAPSTDHPEPYTNGDDKINTGALTKPQFARGLCDQRIVAGKPAVLECQVTGEPEPDIFWYRDGLEIGEINPRYRFEFEGDHGVCLVIKNARMSDAGTYTCKAVNGAGSVESSAKLTAGVPARIESDPRNLEVIAGKTITISCHIVGNPEPEVTWTKYRKEVEESDRKHTNTTESCATLVIGQACDEDAGRYHVTVCNELGMDSLEISVSVVDKPDPPAGKPTASDINHTYLTLSWVGPSYDGGSRLLGYLIEMCRVDDRKWRTVTSTPRTSHVIADLQPDVEYRFRVSAENVHGFSDPSLESDPVLMRVVEADTATDGKIAGDSDDDSEVFVARGDVIVRTDKEVNELYDMKEQCGKGRYGVVYRCVEKSSGKQFAAKFIKIKSSDRDAVRNEIRIMNELHHPKLLQCVDAFEGLRQTVMVTDFIAGGELFERVIDDDFVLTEKDAIKFIRQICAGVHYMHQKNILHLDLKPENVMCVDTHGCRIKLIDFGLARKFDPNKSTKVLFGTPEFVAPEVINYEHIGFATDMWSVGVICYILLSGLSPFMGDSDAETLNNVTAAEWDFDDEAFDDISDEAKDFIETLLIKKKEKRLTVEECLQHQWLTKDIKTMKGTQISTAKLKKFVARRRWQKTTTAVRAIGRMASLTMFSGLRRASDHSPSPPCSPTHQTLLRSTLRKAVEETINEPSGAQPGEAGKGSKEEKRGSGDGLQGQTVNSSCEEPSEDRRMNQKDSGTEERGINDKETLKDGNPDKTLENDVNGYEDDSVTDSEISRIEDLSLAPKITKHTVDATVFEGDCARFDCRVEGHPEPEVTWYQDDEEIHESARFLIEQDDGGLCSLIIKNICEDDDAEYMVEAVNSTGKASSIAELIVHVPGAK